MVERHWLIRTLNFWLTTITIASLGVGIVGVILAFLALREPKPEVTFETISEANVFDLRRPLKDLGISFRERNIQEQGLNLRILSISIKNTGEVDILPSHYDQEDDWGIQISEGELIEARLLDSNSDFLKSKVVPERKDIRTVIFPKLIFEKGDVFTVEMLVLHPKEAFPTISPLGKIAGIENITVLKRALDREEASLLSNLFPGNTLVQAIRSVIYVFGAFVILILLVVTIVGATQFTDNQREKARRKRISASVAVQQLEQDTIRQQLIDYYATNGPPGLREMQELLRHPERIVRIRPPEYWGLEFDQLHRQWPRQRGEMFFELEYRPERRALSAMERMGVLNVGPEKQVKIDPAFLLPMEEILGELGR